MSDIEQGKVPENTEQNVEKEVTNITLESIDSLYKDNQNIFDEWINNSNNVKKALTPWKDSHVSQGINTYKEKTLPQLEAELRTKIMKEVNPPKNPYEEKVIEIDAKLKAAEEKARQAEIKARGANYIGQIGFDLAGIMSPEELAKGTEEDTIDYINKVKDLAKYYEEKGRKSFIKDNNYTPPSGETNEAVPYGGDEKKWQDAMINGLAPKSGPEFEKTRVAILNYKHGKK